MKWILILVALAGICGCDNGAVKDVPAFSVGDKVVISEQIGIICDYPYESGGKWQYSVCVRGKFMWVHEKQLQLQKHMDWNEEPCTAPITLKIEGIPEIPGSSSLPRSIFDDMPIMKPDKKDRTT